jgi:hypothetical protein
MFLKENSVIKLYKGGKSLNRKGLTVGIILLFIGTCIIPSTGGFTIMRGKNDNPRICNTFDTPPVEEWNRTYEGFTGFYVFCTDDAGYVIGGDIGDTFQHHDYLLIKVDSNGNEQWRRTFGRNGSDELHGMTQTNDGGYVLLGASQKGDVNSTWEVWLVRTNNQGDLIWDRTLESLIQANDFSIQQTSDLGFIIAGGDPKYKPHITKINDNGYQQWNKTYECDGLSFTDSVVQTYDDGYVLTGGNFLLNFTFVIKTDSSGNELWRATYPLPDMFNGYGRIIETSDKGFIISQAVYNTTMLEQYVWIFKTDLNGLMEWNITIWEIEWTYISSIQQTSDNGFILAGSHTNHDTGWYALLIKIDKEGKEKWRKIMGGGWEFFNSVAITPDLGYILTGESYSYKSYQHTVWLVKLSPDNLSPETPNIEGEKIGRIGIEYTYAISAVDPSGNQVSYVIDWGDGQQDETELSESGQQIEANHTWTSDNLYSIRVKAVDEYGFESDWSEPLIVFIGKTTFLWGKITNLTNQNQIITFNVILVRARTFIPWTFNQYTTNEKIMVSEADYPLHRINTHFVLGRFNAII